MTKRPTSSERRRFKHWDDACAFVDALADHPDVPVRGAWTPGQIVFHLAAAIKLSCAQRPSSQRRTSRMLRWPLRVLLLRRGIPRGRAMPAEARVRLDPSPEARFADQRSRLLEAMQAFERVRHDMPPHPVLGDLTHDEWRLFHLRHCELHLGMIDLPRDPNGHG